MKKLTPAYLYLAITGIVFVALTAVFLLLPRTRHSELEKRDLAEFPAFSDYAGNLAGFTGAISQWFSDSEPFRDDFMTLSMAIRHAIGMHPGNPDDAVSFKPSDTPPPSDEQAGEDDLDDAEAPPVEGFAKLAGAGTIVAGSGDRVRGLMVFGASPKAGERFAETANRYAEAFPGVNIYALVAPLATEYYLPEKAKSLSNPQRPVIEHIYELIEAPAKPVNAYRALAAHAGEDIYLRTDHHWAPLGGFYAAREFAKTAGVPFRELDSYESHTIHKFVGSMYGYTKDIALKNAPEDFTYYTPKGLDYTTTFTTYKVNKDYRIVSSGKPFRGEFFKKFKDGTSNAYLTFMGSDQNLVKVNTGTPSNRRLLIIKDSYGNALPGYLFYSFGEVHVIDFRYFPGNLKEYVKANGITDILLAFNIFNACTPSVMKRVANLIDKEAEAPHSASSGESNPDKPVPAVQQGAAPQQPAPKSAPAPQETKEPEPIEPEPSPAE